MSFTGVGTADNTIERILYNQKNLNSNASFRPPASSLGSPRGEYGSGAERTSVRTRYSAIDEEDDMRVMPVPVVRERERANNSYPRREAIKPTETMQREREAPLRELRRRGDTKINGVEAGGMNPGGVAVGNNNLMDFYSNEVFHIVMHNPTTAHRFKRFCQSRACGESMEFLSKVDAYIRLIDSTTQILSQIHDTYISPDASRRLPLPPSLSKRVTADIKYTTQTALPSLEEIFAEAQENTQHQLASDIYPRFVKHQITASATNALSDDRSRYAGLGDCFCLTDPFRADNPIVFASDGFVSVTGYPRKDIVPRNCRFLQGPQTDQLARQRLRAAIDNCEETVELLLNYHKDGDPFWNLLYVSPLYDGEGEVRFFLGGQINCSTTIHSCTDILKVLSAKDEDFDEGPESGRPESVRSGNHVASGGNGNSKPVGPPVQKSRSSFFKSFRKYAPRFSGSKVESEGMSPGGAGVKIRPEAGIEGELIQKVGRMNFKTQVEAFYTTYSKYLVLSYPPYQNSGSTSNLSTFTLPIHHHSASVVDLLALSPMLSPTLFTLDIFKLLASHSSASSSFFKSFKGTVKQALERGEAVSVECGLLTGMEEARRNGRGILGREKEASAGWKRVEERYVCHWTPVKDEEARVGFVVLVIAPKF